MALLNPLFSQIQAKGLFWEELGIYVQGISPSSVEQLPEIFMVCVFKWQIQSHAVRTVAHICTITNVVVEAVNSRFQLRLPSAMNLLSNERSPQWVNV